MRWQSAGALLLALLGPPLAHAGEAPLRLCALSHNLPYAEQATQRGFDLATAEAVSRALARTLEVVWTDNGEGIAEIDESDYPLHRLARGDCDFLLSMPGPARDTLGGLAALALGQAYYGAAFEIIGPAGTSAHLRDLRDKPIAIQAQTIASFALVMLHGRQKTYFSPRAALDGVRAGEAVAALLWGPTAGWALRETQDNALTIAADYVPPPALSWNLHVATRKADEALRAALDAALLALAQAGALEPVAAAWGIPWHPPFATTYSLTEIGKLR